MYGDTFTSSNFMNLMRLQLDVHSPNPFRLLQSQSRRSYKAKGGVGACWSS